MHLASRLFTILALVATPSFASAQGIQEIPVFSIQLAQSYSCGRTCTQVSSCREAVYQWCVCGYRRADGDNDGVPCESVCGQSTRRNIEQVRSFMRELGCR